MFDVSNYLFFYKYKYKLTFFSQLCTYLLFCIWVSISNILCKYC